jgi:hypothetical protein
MWAPLPRSAPYAESPPRKPHDRAHRNPPCRPARRTRPAAPPPRHHGRRCQRRSGRRRTAARNVRLAQRRPGDQVAAPQKARTRGLESIRALTPGGPPPRICGPPELLCEAGAELVPCHPVKPLLPSIRSSRRSPPPPRDCCPRCYPRARRGRRCRAAGQGSEIRVQSQLRELVAEEVRALLARHRLNRAKLVTAIDRSEMYVSRRLRGDTAFDLDDLGEARRCPERRVSDLIPTKAGSNNIRQ